MSDSRQTTSFIDHSIEAGILLGDDVGLQITPCAAKLYKHVFALCVYI